MNSPPSSRFTAAFRNISTADANPALCFALAGAVLLLLRAETRFAGVPFAGNFVVRRTEARS